MSIEIEVGLENAPRVPVKLEEPRSPEPPKGMKNPKVQRLSDCGRDCACRRGHRTFSVLPQS